MSAEEQILKLFEQHHKPFNVQQIVDWLAQYGIKKTQIQKTLDSLVEGGKIVGKDFGKTRIYIPPQQGLKQLSKEDLEKQKAEIKRLKDDLAKETGDVRELEQELRSWTSSMTEEEIDAATKKLSLQCKELEDKLAKFRSGAKLVTKEEKAKVDKELTVAMEEWRKRRSVFRNIWNTISENLDGKQADYYEDMGVETDESLGVSFAELEKILPGKRRRL